MELGNPGSIRAKVANEYRRLLNIRSGCKVFHPASPQEIIRLDPKLFCLRRWTGDGKEELYAIHNVSSEEVNCSLPEPVKGDCRDLISGKVFRAGRIAVPPWTALWLTPCVG